MPIRKKTKATTGSRPRSRAKKGFKSTFIIFFKIIILVLGIFIFASVTWVILYKYVEPPCTFLMCKRKMGSILRGEPNKISYKFVPYEQISPYLKIAVIASEDQKFPFHNGFDLVSIAKAMEHNKFSKRKHGASTISQQTAKNVFLWDGRNFVRKGLEAYFTVLIEWIWGKQRILEIYLNVIEMGPLTFGAEAAAKKNFNKNAADLSKQEACLVAATLPNPILFSAKRPTSYLLKRTQWIMQQCNALGGTDYVKFR